MFDFRCGFFRFFGGEPYSCRALSKVQIYKANRLAEGWQIEIPESGLERVQEVLWAKGAKASCTSANWGGSGAKQVLDGARGSWETFAPWVCPCPPPPPPRTTILCKQRAESPPAPPHEPTPHRHPDPQAIVGPIPGTSCP